MPRPGTAANWKELTPEERRDRRQLRREKQREDNIGRAAKMHAARLRMEAERPKGPPELKSSVYVGCSGWRYWKWRDSFYAGVPQENWFEHYLKRFDTVEINASFYSWPTVANVQAWRRQPGRKRFVYTVKVCELITHVKRFNGTKTLIRDFGVIADIFGRPDGLLSVPTAAELPLHKSAAARDCGPARSRAPQRGGVSACQLVERGSLPGLSGGRNPLLLLQRTSPARRAYPDNR
jgi:hypothetical protein